MTRRVDRLGWGIGYVLSVACLVWLLGHVLPRGGERGPAAETKQAADASAQADASQTEDLNGQQRWRASLSNRVRPAAVETTVPWVIGMAIVLWTVIYTMVAFAVSGVLVVPPKGPAMRGGEHGVE